MLFFFELFLFDDTFLLRREAEERFLDTLEERLTLERRPLRLDLYARLRLDLYV